MDDLMLAVTVIVGVPLLFLILVAAWPLLLCWYLGYPAIGVLAEVLWLCLMR